MSLKYSSRSLLTPPRQRPNGLSKWWQQRSSFHKLIIGGTNTLAYKSENVVQSDLVIIIIYDNYRAPNSLKVLLDALTISTLVLWTCSSQCHFNSPRSIYSLLGALSFGLPGRNQCLQRCPVAWLEVHNPKSYKTCQRLNRRTDGGQQPIAIPHLS